MQLLPQVVCENMVESADGWLTWGKVGQSHAIIVQSLLCGQVKVALATPLPCRTHNGLNGCANW